MPRWTSGRCSPSMLKGERGLSDPRDSLIGPVQSVAGPGRPDLAPSEAAWPLQFFGTRGGCVESGLSLSTQLGLPSVVFPAYARTASSAGPGEASDGRGTAVIVTEHDEALGREPLGLLGRGIRIVSEREKASVRTRPSVDEVMLETAAVWARLSTCSRLAVGAVLARDGRVLVTAYNGAPTGFDHCKHKLDQLSGVCVHAEANALLGAARHGLSTLDTTMFCTHAPCLACSGLLLNAGVTRVVYRERFKSGGLARLAVAGVKVEHLG